MTKGFKKGKIGLLVKREHALVMFVVFSLLIIVVPLKSYILDFLIALNFIFSLALFFSVFFLSRPRAMNNFPGIILLLTLFRLSLNISSTRLILQNGQNGLSVAGRIIQAFGTYVVSSDFIVGVVIFFIIAVVNFLVIAKGAARVAEVAARFALDSLPGRQYAIDSDLRSGILDSSEASKRRDDLSIDSQFYGAMDGAMKFVQGDALASIVISLINLFGGISIALFSRDLSMSEAINTYGVLTIGDGLVSILPSLLLALSSGILVTHIKKDGSSASGIIQNLLSNKSALVSAAIVAFVLSLIPNLPFFPFFIISLFLSYLCYQSQNLDNSSVDLRRESFLKLRVPYELAFKQSEFSKEFEMRRNEFFNRTGIDIGFFDFQQIPDLEKNKIIIDFRNRPVFEFKLPIDKLYVKVSSAILGNFGIKDGMLEFVSNSGYEVFSFESNDSYRTLETYGFKALSSYQVLSLELVCIAEKLRIEFIGINYVKSCLNRQKKQTASLQEEVFSKGLLSLSEFSEIIRRLVGENISILDFQIILDSICEFFSTSIFTSEERESCLEELHSFIRFSMINNIIAESRGSKGELKIFQISGEIEEEIRDLISKNHKYKRPIFLDEIYKQRFIKTVSPVWSRTTDPVVFVSSDDVRSFIHKYLSNIYEQVSRIRTLSYQELNSENNYELIATI